MSSPPVEAPANNSKASPSPETMPLNTEATSGSSSGVGGMSTGNVSIKMDDKTTTSPVMRMNRFPKYLIPTMKSGIFKTSCVNPIGVLNNSLTINVIPTMPPDPISFGLSSRPTKIDCKIVPAMMNKVVSTAIRFLVFAYIDNG